MNPRSTLAAGGRARSGHRYRDDDEPFAHAEPNRRSFPSSNHRYGTAAPAGYAGTHRDAEAPAAAWQADAEWNRQDSWSDGGAWNTARNSWTPDADEAWTPAPASEGRWSPDADNAWTPAEDDAWQHGRDESGRDWSAPQGEWTPESQGSWAPESQGEWAPDAQGEWAPEAEREWDSDSAWTEAGDERPTPTVIPARTSRRRGGAHRVPAPPTALKGRAAVVAVAAGAVVAAGQAASASTDEPSHTIDYEAAGQVHEIAAQSISLADPAAAASPDSPQMLNVTAPSNLGEFNEILEKGRKYAEELAAAEAAKLRPLFARFAAGNFTSGFGARWGVQHLGIDVAGPIGTPIYAVADGTVIEAGPAAGFGMWVRILHDDGTVTIYGHIDTATVSQGERVLAGDQIATMGNRGFSTGPHVHFEVWLNGVDKVDPVPWLATRGISLGQMRD
ncbi:murein DD-endopeptidase MepM/ murein hydrolase activator NlpD [Nocardia puris]|uniref:Murein DD-endopeptidase MepM/ murein hydrolase activator NlpD n=2 Tax=Nocardia puris TaxID=208602 RepID=A0A366D520_9NOCA|nr:murein DD-endopeptidase MepM/ murein hydrolase activator NlpD [Nocardia puris]